MPEGANALHEPIYTAAELATAKRLHPTTIRKLFVNEPGVIRFAIGRRLGRRHYYSLRIPHSVVERVFGRMTVSGPSGDAST
jgi:hypothetical protein